MTKLSKGHRERKRVPAKRRRRERPVAKSEELDRALFKQLLQLNARRCGSRRDAWDTAAVAGYLRRHGYPSLQGGTVRYALLLAGFRHSKETNAWEMGPQLAIPPSPRAFAYRLRELSRRTVVNPSLLIPTYNRFKFLQVLARTGRWMQRAELVPKAAPGMDKNTANSLLDALVGGQYVETRSSEVGRPRGQWRILAHGRRTAALMRSFTNQLQRRMCPTVADAEVLQLLRAFPNGLYGQQIFRVLGVRRSGTKPVHLLKRAMRNGYIEATTLADTVDCNLWGHKRWFYRMTPDGDRWARALEALTASRFPERAGRKPSGRYKRIVDDGDIPLTDRFREEITTKEISRQLSAL